MGSFQITGFIPTYNQHFPAGQIQYFPDWMRKYVPKFKNTNHPFLTTNMDFSAQTYMPFGHKKLPNFKFLSDKRKMYVSIMERNFKEIQNLIDNGFNLNEIVFDDQGYTPLG